MTIRFTTGSSSSSPRSTRSGSARPKAPRRPEDRHRRDPLKVSLDQGWDLLGHRRALREAGLETEAARVCGPNVVEGYEQ